MIIREAKVTYIPCMHLKLYLTDHALYFDIDKGIYGKEKKQLMFNTIEKVDTFRVAFSGGIVIVERNGKKHKFAFGKKKDFEAFYEYLSNIDFSLPREYGKSVCVYCGAKIEGKYCSECGQLHVVKEEEPIVQTCWSCGGIVPSNAKFCADCGAKQDVNKLLVRIGGELAKKHITTVCPKCHSRNIKIYRKGYNYKIGFWGAIFGVKGAGYAAGFDSNKACCRCMNCGKDWETDYDYRLL